MNRQAVPEGRVPHVEDQDGRHSRIQDLTDEIQMPFQIRGIGNAQHSINCGQIRLSPQQHVDGGPSRRANEARDCTFPANRRGQLFGRPTRHARFSSRRSLRDSCRPGPFIPASALKSVPFSCVGDCRSAQPSVVEQQSSSPNQTCQAALFEKLRPSDQAGRNDRVGISMPHLDSACINHP